MEEQQANGAYDIALGMLTRMQAALKHEIFTPDKRLRSEEQHGAMRRMAQDLESKVFANMDRVASKNPNVIDLQFRAAATGVATQLAAVLYVSGFEREGGQVLRVAAAHAPEDRRAELHAVGESRQAFCELQHARFLLRAGDEEGGDKLLDSVARRRGAATAIRDAARKLWDRPLPLDEKAPDMITYKGIGARLRGRRKPIDQTRIATLYFVFFYIPIFPIAAYRVTRHRGGRYTFHSKQKLGPLARWYWHVLGFCMGVGIPVTLVYTYLSWPDRPF